MVLRSLSLLFFSSLLFTLLFYFSDRWLSWSPIPSLSFSCSRFRSPPAHPATAANDIRDVFSPGGGSEWPQRRKPSVERYFRRGPGVGAEHDHGVGGIQRRCQGKMRHTGRGARRTTQSLAAVVVWPSIDYPPAAARCYRASWPLCHVLALSTCPPRHAQAFPAALTHVRAWHSLKYSTNEFSSTSGYIAARR